MGIDAPICQDGRSGGFTELLARAEVSHDALIDFPSEKAFKASDDVPFRPSIRPASDDIVDRRLVIAHTDHDGSMEGGVRLSVAAPIKAVSTGGHPGGGGDGTRAAELGTGGFRANPLRVIPEDNEHRGGGVGANGEALPGSIRARRPPRPRNAAMAERRGKTFFVARVKKTKPRDRSSPTLLPIMDRQLGKLGNIDQGPLSWLVIVVSATDDSDDARTSVHGGTAT